MLPIWGQTFFGGGFCIFFLSEALFIERSFLFFSESEHPRGGTLLSQNCRLL